MFDSNFFAFIFCFTILSNVTATLNVKNSSIELTNANSDSIISNATKVPPKMKEENETKIYENYLSKVKNYCLTKAEMEELYGNKSPFDVVFYICSYLISAASEQIGLNELRQIFHLKPQNFNFFEKTKEEPIDLKNKSEEEFNQNLKYFQEKINERCEDTFNMKFWPKEIEIAEKFLDKKFPEIRKMFKLKYQEKLKTHKNEIPFKKDTIDKMFDIFVDTQSDMIDAAQDLNFQSHRRLRKTSRKQNACKH